MTAPDWVDDPQQCPVEDCDGEYWFDVGGSATRPQTIIHSSCNHNLEKCSQCSDIKPRNELNKFTWPVNTPDTGPGEWRNIRLCSHCETYKYITKYVPDYILNGDYRGWWK